jgi:hypothetical protein
MKKAAKPKMPRGLRTRERSDGSLRMWWEPRAEDRAAGAVPVELDADRLSWSMKEADRLNAAVQAMREGKPAAPGKRSSRLIADLIGSYRSGVHWQEGLKPKTRNSYDKLLLVIGDKWGGHRAADFDKAVMHAWYETLHRTRGPRMAQALIRMMSILFAHAEVLGWRRENSNPCLRLKVKTPAPRNRAATVEEVRALIASAEALGLHSMALAIRLGVLQGQRQTDIREAQRGAFALRPWLAPGEAEPRMRWVWTLRRSKRGNLGAMVVHDEAVPALRAALANAGTAARPLLATDALIRDEATGQAFSEFLFNKRWLALRAHAAAPEHGAMPSVADLQFRDLRRTFGVLARAAGVTDDDVGDVLGNSMAVNPTLAETYTPASFETASRAVAALSLAPKGKKA